MHKILLINPPIKEYKGSIGFNLCFPIGLLSIAGKLRSICDLFFLDCLSKDFEIKKEKDYILYGTSIDNIKKKIKEINPDLIGITAAYSSQSEKIVEIAKICKKISKKSVVVIGGAEATIRYNFYLKNNYCDFCVIGEGEDTFAQLVKKLGSVSSMKRCDGIAFLDKENIILNKQRYISNLDLLPLPEYNLIDYEYYFKNKYLYRNRSFIPNRSISIITSRGCPFDCFFCSIFLHMGKKYRFHSPEYVINHLKLLKKKMGIKSIHFEDDNFTLNKERANKIFKKMIEEKINLSWDTPNGVRADTLDYGLLEKMKKSGCKHLTIAIESGDQHILDKIINKKLKLQQTIDVAKICKKMGIKLSAFYMIGLPGENLENMKKTTDLAINLLKKYEVIPQLNIATPLFGTKMYDLCLKKGYINIPLNDKSLSEATQIYGNPMISTEEFSIEDLKKVFRDYQNSIKNNMIFFGLKHPLFSIKRILKNPSSLKNIF